MTAVQRRTQLLDVGRAVFAERGVDAASVELVALRAGVSKPVVYDHFGGKDGLHAVVVDREVQRLAERLTGALTDRSAHRLLEQTACALLHYVEDEADGFRVLAREAPRPATGTAGLAALVAAVTARVEDLLGAGSTGGDAMAGLSSQALVGQASLVGQWWLDHPEHDRDAVAAHLVDLVWHGLSSAADAPVSPGAAPGPRP